LLATILAGSANATRAPEIAYPDCTQIAISTIMLLWG